MLRGAGGAGTKGDPCADSRTNNGGRAASSPINEVAASRSYRTVRRHRASASDGEGRETSTSGRVYGPRPPGAGAAVGFPSAPVPAAEPTLHLATAVDHGNLLLPSAPCLLACVGVLQCVRFSRKWRREEGIAIRERLEEIRACNSRGPPPAGVDPLRRPGTSRNDPGPARPRGRAECRVRRAGVRSRRRQWGERISASGESGGARQSASWRKRR